jgi:hypothetical protein
MVLDAEQVVTEPVEEPRGPEHAERIAGVRNEEVAELERLPVVQTPGQRWRRSFHGHDFL